MAFALGAPGGLFAHWMWLHGATLKPQPKPIVVTESGKSYRSPGYHWGWVGYTFFGAFCGLFSASISQLNPWKTTGLSYPAAIVSGFGGGVCLDLIFMWIRTKWYKQAFGVEPAEIEDKNLAIKRLRQENRKLRKMVKVLEKILEL